jgi:hypothetical protein
MVRSGGTERFFSNTAFGPEASLATSTVDATFSMSCASAAYGAQVVLSII